MASMKWKKDWDLNPPGPTGALKAFCELTAARYRELRQISQDAYKAGNHKKATQYAKKMERLRAAHQKFLDLSVIPAEDLETQK